MNPSDRTPSALALFEAICDLAPEAQRRELDAIAASEPDVHTIVRRLLAADARTHALLDEPPDFSDLVEEPPPATVGSFRIIERLGGGGMGVVYTAEQDHPRRQVALKLMHRRMSTPRLSRLFRFEADALGALLHPGIPQIYEAGEHEGRLFIAMERVTGERLDVWAATERPDARTVAALMVGIAEAVQHAHLCGIVHRDLKPANVLVTPEGRPKVLDFGIAGLVDGPVDGVSGTTGYMSPEQRRPSSRVDVRSDVYSLGVLLRALFATAPHADLEAIAARATATNPADRYSSVEAFAEELRRFLTWRPVHAREAGVAYRAARFARRHRLLVLGTGLVLLTATLGTAAATLSYLDAERARAEAVAALSTAEAATSEALQANEVSSAIQTVFTSLVLEAGPDRSGPGVTVLDALDEAEGVLDREPLTSQPAIAAEARMALAELESQLGERPKAIAHLEWVEAQWRAGELEDSPVVVSEALYGLADIRHFQGDLTRSEALLEESIRVGQDHWPPGDAAPIRRKMLMATLAGRRGDPDRAAAIFAEAVDGYEARAHGLSGTERQQAVAEQSVAQRNLAIQLHHLGRSDEARVVLDAAEAALEDAGGNGGKLARIAHTRAWMEHRLGNLLAARIEIDRALALRRTLYPPGALDIAETLQFSALLQREDGHPEQAVETLREAIPDLENALGPAHVRLIEPHHYLVWALIDLGRHAEALADAEALHSRFATIHGSQDWRALLASLLVIEASARGTGRDGSAALDRVEAQLQAMPDAAGHLHVVDEVRARMTQG